MPITDDRRAEAQSILSEYGFTFDEIVELTEPDKFKKMTPTSRDYARERHLRWVDAFKAGQTVPEIAVADKVSHEAVRQVLHKYGAWVKRVQIKRDKVSTDPNAAAMRIYGVPRDVVNEYKEFAGPYTMHRGYIKSKGESWAMNLVDWAAAWAASGHWKERGNKDYSYGMTRKEHSQPWSIDNIEILPNREIRAARRWT